MKKELVIFLEHRLTSGVMCITAQLRVRGRNENIPGEIGVLMNYPPGQAGYAQPECHRTYTPFFIFLYAHIKKGVPYQLLGEDEEFLTRMANVMEEVKSSIERSK